MMWRAMTFTTIFTLLAIVSVQRTGALPVKWLQAREEGRDLVVASLVERRPLGSPFKGDSSSAPSTVRLPSSSEVFAGHRSPGSTSPPAGSGRNSPEGLSPLPSPVNSPPTKVWRSQPPSPPRSPRAQEARLPPGPGRKKRWAWFAKENNRPPAVPGMGAGGRLHQIAKTAWAATRWKRPHP